MARKINQEIIHKEIIYIKIKGLSKIRAKVIKMIISIIKNPLIIIDIQGMIAMIKEIRDSISTDIYKFQF
jgi:Iap family predicted aminopeptidase